MERITTPSRQIDKWGPGKDGFTDGNPAAGQMSTQLNGDWYDQLQEEVANQIELELGPLDAGNMFQLNESITAQIGRAVAAAGGNFVLRAGDTMTGPLVNSAGRFIASTVAAPSITLWPANDPVAWGLIGTPAALTFGQMTAAGTLSAQRMIMSATGLAVDGTLSLQTSSGYDLYLASAGASRGLNFLSDAAGPLGPGVWQWSLNATSRDLGWSGPGPTNLFMIAGGGPGSVNAIPGRIQFRSYIGWPLTDAVNGWSLGDNPLIGINVYSEVGGGAVYGLIPLAGSDARIKEKLADYTIGLDAIRQIDVIRYRFRGNTRGPGQEHIQIDSGGARIGISAQDIEGLLPEMVFQTNGYIDGEPVEDFRCINTEPLLWTMVNAIKELDTRLAAVEWSQQPQAPRAPQGRMPR